MRSRLIATWGLPLLVLGVALFAMAPLDGDSSAAVKGNAADWQYQAISDTGDSFDLRFSLSDLSEIGRGRFRIVLGDISTKAFFIEMGPDGTRTGNADGGIERLAPPMNTASLAELSGSEIVYEQRRERWALCANGRLLASGGNPPPENPMISLGSAGAKIDVADFRFQPVADVYFEDSFMRTPEDPNLWSVTRGNWRLSVLRDPLLSVNAFQYIGVGSDGVAGEGDTAPVVSAPEEIEEPDELARYVPKSPLPAVAEALAGDWFWSNLSYSAAVKASSCGAAGIIFCHRGPGDYYLFRWSSADTEGAGSKLVRYSNGVETVLAESNEGYDPNQWYRIGADVGIGWAQIKIDDTVLFRVRDEFITYGRIGIYAEGYLNTYFDDVVVKNGKTSTVDFGRLCAGEGLITGGEWLPVAAISREFDVWPGGIVAKAGTASRLVWGNPRWKDYAISTRIGPVSGGSAGLCLYYQDEKNHYLARYHEGETPSVDLVKVAGGAQEVLASAQVARAEWPRSLEAIAENGELALALDGKKVLQVLDASPARGRMGLYGEALEHGVFSDVSFEFLQGKPPIVTNMEVFESEESMLNWAGPLSDWRPKPADVANDPDTWWHRSDFFGDIRVNAKITPGEGEGAAMLMVSALSEDATSGFRGELSWGSEGTQAELTLTSPAGESQKAAIDRPAAPLTLELARIGGKIALMQNGRVMLSAVDDREAPGMRLGWSGKGIDLRYDHITIYSDNVFNYSFKSAPVEWRHSSGIWEVSNRWTCDPRWSFFSGRKRKGTATLWNKRPISGDFTIEFYVGNKMDNIRKQDAARYDYASDMDITVCADGNNLDSGYSFLFGGFNNTVTAAFRNREKWAEPEEGKGILIEPARLHRRWYHIAVSRRGNKLEMRVDDQLVLSKDDPEPLKGGQWAIWTRDNGIMVSRVRVSAEEFGELEPPDPSRPKPARSIYTQ